MITKGFMKVFPVIGFGFVVAVIDLIISLIISPGRPSIFMATIDFSVLVLLGLISLKLIKHAKTPFLLNDSNTNGQSRKSRLLIILMSIMIILINTVVWYFSYEQYLHIPWINSLTPVNAILISLKAGIQEEILFRLFLFSLLIFLLRKVFRSEKIVLLTSTIISALLFAVLLHSGSLISLIAGMVLAYIYFKEGLLPAMAIHFLGDCIPFLMVSLQNRGMVRHC